MVRNHPYVAEEVILRDLGSLDPEEEVPGALEVHFSTQAESGWDNTYTIEEIS